jgi:hypothetical protein
MTDIKKQAVLGAAEIGVTVLREQAMRGRLIKELEGAADRWEAAANAQPAAVSELKDYYRSKAASARQRARELREGKP